MQQDDLISSLTRQVKEEVLENYLTERRLVDLQIEDIQERAGAVGELAAETGKRIARLSILAIREEMFEGLKKLLRIPDDSFWFTCLCDKRCRGVRFIAVKAFTSRAKYKKLFGEAYRRLYTWMQKYKVSYNELQADCAAVNMNIKAFQNNFDLLAIINFLKSLDVSGLQKKHFLGENFTAEELSSVDRKLYIQTIAFDKLHLPEPLELSAPETAERAVNDFSSVVFDAYENQARNLLR
jgi:hypothetical protein